MEHGRQGEDLDSQALANAFRECGIHGSNRQRHQYLCGCITSMSSKTNKSCLSDLPATPRANRCVMFAAIRRRLAST
jgi:hypothetical protein